VHGLIAGLPLKPRPFGIRENYWPGKMAIINLRKMCENCENPDFESLVFSNIFEERIKDRNITGIKGRRF